MPDIELAISSALFAWKRAESEIDRSSSASLFETSSISTQPASQAASFPRHQHPQAILTLLLTAQMQIAADLTRDRASHKVGGTESALAARLLEGGFIRERIGADVGQGDV